MSELKYDPIADSFFNVFQDVGPVKSNRTMHMPLGDIELPEGWYVNDNGIPMKGEEPETTPKGGTMINDNNPEVFSTSTNGKKITKQQSLDNGKKVISLLTQRLNLTAQQAAGIAGVIMSESRLNPANFNRAEKAGKLKSSKANGPGYGAGLLQWSMGRKDDALALIGKNSPIETLSLEDQVEIIARELEGPYKNALEGIRKSSTASQAAATMYCHNTGGSSDSSSPATRDEIDKMNKRYSKFGNPHVVNDGMNYAEQLMEYYSKNG